MDKKEFVIAIPTVHAFLLKYGSTAMGLFAICIWWFCLTKIVHFLSFSSFLITCDLHLAII